MKTRAQQDAKLAYDQISQLPPEVNGKAYGGLCHHFPMLVLRSGLCQAVAFYTVKAKGTNHALAFEKYLEHMAMASGHGDVRYEDFQRGIHEMSLSQYRHVTRRILAAAIWYKRYAVSVLGVDSTGGEECL